MELAKTLEASGKRGHVRMEGDGMKESDIEIIQFSVKHN